MSKPLEIKVKIKAKGDPAVVAKMLGPHDLKTLAGKKRRRNPRFMES